MELLNRNRLVIVSPRRTPPKASGGPARRGFYTFRSFCNDGGGGGEDEGDREILEPLQCKTLLHLQRFLQDSALFFKTSGVVLYFVFYFCVNPQKKTSRHCSYILAI